MDWVNGLTSLSLAASVPLVIWVGYKNRQNSVTGKSRGIGWQFIRFTVLSIALPVVAILALNGALTGEASTLIAGVMGYAFGKSVADDDA